PATARLSTACDLPSAKPEESGAARGAHGDPGRRMVTGFRLEPNPSVDAGVLQTFRERGVEEEVVDPEPSVALGVLAEVVPERVDHPLAGNLPQRIRPALRQQPFE